VDDLLITGASGYLGAELARRAPGATGTHLTAECPGGVRLDVREADAVAGLVGELRPRAVIHTAYRETGSEAEGVNVEGSRNVARAAAEVGARLVHVSTDLIFDGGLGRPYTEADEPRPILEYGRQKLAAEAAVRELLPGALVVRTSLIYGGAEPSRHERVALGADGMKFFTDELRSPAQVGDLAAALLELARSDRAGVLHVAGADGVSRHEFARLVVAACGGDPDALASGLAAEHPTPRPLDCRLDSSRAQAMLRTRLRGVREVLCA
jgi:dTDP-4-dehydrorhamnose reductase